MLVEWIKKGFRETGSTVGKHAKRDLLFTALDVAAIASEKDKFAPLVKYRIETTRKVYDDLKRNGLPKSGLVIYKLYNEGTILCSPKGCVGIDVILHPESNHLGSGFAEMLDGLLVSHADRDHNDQVSELHPKLKKAGKPVVLPELNEAVPFGGILTSGQIGNTLWTAFRGGHLSLRFSAFYHVRMGDWNVVHSGDNTLWMNFAKSGFARNIDIFFFKPEAIYVYPGEEKDRLRKIDIQEAMVDTLREIRPRLVIPHHLLELGHGLGAYGHDMGLRLFQQASEGVKVQMLQWGESVHLKR